MSTIACASLSVSHSVSAFTSACHSTSVLTTASASLPACRQVAPHRSLCRRLFVSSVSTSTSANESARVSTSDYALPRVVKRISLHLCKLVSQCLLVPAHRSICHLLSTAPPPLMCRPATRPVRAHRLKCRLASLRLPLQACQPVSTSACASLNLAPSDYGATSATVLASNSTSVCASLSVSPSVSTSTSASKAAIVSTSD